MQRTTTQITHTGAAPAARRQTGGGIQIGWPVSVLARMAVTDRDCTVDESWLTGRRMA